MNEEKGIKAKEKEKVCGEQGGQFLSCNSKKVIGF
jgi:hypothetical protein